MKSLKTITLAVAAATFLGAGTASAARPASIGNTTWTLQTNVDVTQLIITSQGGPGAPGAAVCRHILGTIGGIAPIRGQYCPSTGDITFVHLNASTGAPVRLFKGSVSDQVSGQPLHVAGTMVVLISAFGDLGEYNFSGTTI